MRVPFLGAALFGSAAVIAATPAQAGQGWNFHADHVLGTSLDLVVVAAQEKVAGFAAQIVQAEIARLEPILSGWRGDSELSALNAASSLSVSRDLFNVIAACESWRDATLGAFSARLGQIENAGAEVRGALAASVDQAVVVLDANSRRIARPETVSFAVDGLAKGYIIDRALEAARNLPGILGVMVDIGGDLRVWGQAPRAGGWRIGVVDAFHTADNAAPALILAVNDKAVATSGLGARGQTIIEPKTGAAADKIRMATAVAPVAADADALASAFAVMTPKDSIALADRLPGVAAHIVDADGNTYVSRDWDAMVVAQNVAPKPPAKVAPAAAANSWPAGFSVKIEYELLPGLGGRRARNPYLTVWITNEAGDLVRMITFQADKYRYMRENYVFWNKFAAQVDLDAVARPTRPPGHYTLEWDGKDDKGRAVPQGKYTINVEGSREHGFHSLQKIELNTGASEASGSAAPLEDMGTIKATYGKAP